MAETERVKQLLEAGRKNGYVLYDELDALLPEDYESGPELDAILAALERAGLNVVVGPRGHSSVQETVDDEATAGLLADDPVRIYLHQVGKVPQLTPDAGIELCKMMQLGTDDGERARKDLVEANLHEVVVLARLHPDCGVHILDLIVEGNNGLLSAADTFDCTRGYRFSAYAGWLARRFIIRATLQGAREVRIPPHLKPPDWVQ